MDKEETEKLKKLAKERWDNYIDATQRLSDLHEENELLKEKVAAQQELIERLMSKK